ncbi:hypothetical protein [Labedaea rhizosphaerae]|uniref:Lipoprotein LprG n=1 Tax=Labedaea rhizosphaerae TaxID=598644 RepID=A0A4R6SAA8_LABRH|nr:hypothetical protein [Labedaea rhizosphaerae]TDP96454.1 hypothetical protein EV186_104442 [Labedaea rhizosphaerae]
MLRRIGAGLLVLVAAGSMTACGKSANGGSAGGDRLAVQHVTFGQLIQAMAGKTKADWSAHTAGTITVDGAGQNVAIKFTGDSKKTAGSLQMQAEYAIDSGTEQLTMSMVIDGHVAYLKLPANAGVPANKPWVKISPDGTDQLSKQLGPQLEQIERSADPRQAVSYLQDNDAVTIKGVRPDQVGGTAADRYDVAIDVTKLLASNHVTLTDQQRQAVTAAGIKSLDESVWISRDSLPLRVTMDQPVGAKAFVKMNMEFTDWGKKVTISAPSSDEITALPGG